VQLLNDFEAHLTNKVQSPLDATLGIINTEQNDLFKVLTIASLFIGISSTFNASLFVQIFRPIARYFSRR
jgi:magnesium transporter